MATDLSAARVPTETPGPGVPWPTTLSEEPDITEPFRGRVYVDYLTLCRQVLPGWEANITYEEGVRRTLEWFREAVVLKGAQTDAPSPVRLED